MSDDGPLQLQEVLTMPNADFKVSDKAAQFCQKLRMFSVLF